MCVPEAATLFNAGGVAWASLSPEQAFCAQVELMRTQIRLEDAFAAVCAGSPSVVLCDRGVLDGRAYVDDSTWSKMLDEVGEDTQQLRDERYDAVVHLVTAAIGAEQYYTLENNAARTESREDATALDRRIRDVYRGAENHFVVPNEPEWSFSDKIDAAVDRVCAVVGVPVMGKRRYFSLHQMPAELPVDTENFLIDYTYLAGPKGSRDRAQMRRHISPSKSLDEALASPVLARDYSLRQKRVAEADNAGFRENQRHITNFRRVNSRNYELLKSRRRMGSLDSVRWRRVFMHDNSVYELDVMIQPSIQIKLAVEGIGSDEMGADSAKDAVSVPPFLDIAEEVTGRPQYRSWYHSLGRPRTLLD